MTTEIDRLIERLRELAEHNRQHFPLTQEEGFIALGDEAADQLELLKAMLAEREICRAVITEANNSLYGSQSFFITTADGSVAGAKGVTDPPDKYHLARRIERLKDDSRAAGRALLHLKVGKPNDALDTLRAALTGEQQ